MSAWDVVTVFTVGTAAVTTVDTEDEAKALAKDVASSGLYDGESRRIVPVSMISVVYWREKAEQKEPHE